MYNTMIPQPQVNLRDEIQEYIDGTKYVPVDAQIACYRQYNPNCSFILGVPEEVPNKSGTFRCTVSIFKDKTDSFPEITLTEERGPEGAYSQDYNPHNDVSRAALSKALRFLGVWVPLDIIRQNKQRDGVPTPAFQGPTKVEQPQPVNQPQEAPKRSQQAQEPQQAAQVTKDRQAAPVHNEEPVVEEQAIVSDTRSSSGKMKEDKSISIEQLEGLKTIILESENTTVEPDTQDDFNSFVSSPEKDAIQHVLPKVEEAQEEAVNPEVIEEPVNENQTHNEQGEEVMTLFDMAENNVANSEPTTNNNSLIMSVEDAGNFPVHFKEYNGEVTVKELVEQAENGNIAVEKFVNFLSSDYVRSQQPELYLAVKIYKDAK